LFSPTDAAHRRRAPARLIALWALGFRVCSALLAFLASVSFPDYQNQRFTMWGRSNPFWDPFVRYDSGWYLAIARSGYVYVPDGRSNIAYFPVYPLLMRYIGRIFGRAPADFYLAGILISWSAFVLAAVALYHLASLDLPRRRAERAPLFAAIFPFAFFFGVVYTESLFLLLIVVCFYCFRTRQWAIGGIAGGLATATRVNGILMLPALALIAWRAAEPNARDRIRAANGLLLVASGVVIYSLFVYRLTTIPGGSHNPLEWAVTLERWGYYPGGAPWTPLLRLVSNLLVRPYAYLTGDPMAPYDTLNGLAALAVVATLPFVWRRLGAAYGLFVAANLWLPLSSGQFEGLGRYCSVMFPFFIWLATIRSRPVLTAVGTVCLLLYGICLSLFANVHPLF
jgi:Mannosyltransferase (PIG-V)